MAAVPELGATLPEVGWSVEVPVEAPGWLASEPGDAGVTGACALAAFDAPVAAFALGARPDVTGAAAAPAAG